MKIKNKLNVLLVGGIVLTSVNYAGKLEPVYLQNVIQYLKTPRDLFNFLQINKKCKRALKKCKTNFIPAFDEKTYNLTYNPSELATRSDYFTSYSEHVHLNEMLDVIVNTPNFKGVLQGDIEVNQYHSTKFRNAKILDSEEKQHKSGDVTLSVRLCELSIGSEFVELDETCPEDYVYYTPNKTFYVHFYLYSDDMYNYFLTGEITGEKTVKKIEGSDLPWYEITYKNAKIGHEYFEKVTLRVFINFFVDQYNPDPDSKIRLEHVRRAEQLDRNKLEKVVFLKEVYFGHLPDDDDETNNKLTLHEKQICEIILNNKNFDKTTLSFYLKSKFAKRSHLEKCYSPKQYKKMYDKSMANILQDIYGLDKNIAEIIEGSKYNRIIVVEVEEGCIVSLPNGLQGCQPIVESENGFKACISNIGYNIPKEYIKDFKEYFPNASENRIRELNETHILVAFPEEMVIRETGQHDWRQPQIFIISCGNENLIIAGKECMAKINNLVLIEIPKNNLNKVDSDNGSFVYETKHTNEDLMLEVQPSPYGRHLTVFQMQ